MTEQNNETPQALTIDDIKSALSEMRDSLREELINETNRAVTGAFTKYKKSQESGQPDIDQLVQQRVDEALQGLKTQPEATKPTTNDSGKGEESPDIEAMINARLEQAIAPYQKAVEDARSEAQRERLNSAKATARQEYLQSISGKVNNPKLFLTALETEKGLTYDPDKGTYGIKGQDEFENPTFTPVSQLQLDSLLQSEDFSIFKPQRPGNGLNSAPNGATPQSPSTPQPLPKDPVQRMTQLKRSKDPMADIVAGLEKTVQSQ